MNIYGREKIYTDYEVIDFDNVISILQDAMAIHRSNSQRCTELLKYEAGEQPILREKVFRKDIDCQCIDNVASEITEFKRGFQWGNPITLIRSDDSDDKNTSAISKLNAQYDADGIRSKTQTIGRYVEICGNCLEYVDLNMDYTEGDAYFTTVPLSPENAFMIYSNYYYDKRPMMGVSYREDKLGNKYFTCITKTHRFEILNEYKVMNGEIVKDKWGHMSRSGEKNPFNMINMVEWIRDDDRLGCFERQMDDMNILNILESDLANGVEQNVMSVWHSNDVQFEEDENGNPIKPESGDWIPTYTAPDGRQPFIKPLTIDYDYSGMLNNILSKRALILQKANVPQRNDNSGGSTGVAMSDATGWSSAEMAASKQQPYQESAKMWEVKVVLNVIKESPVIKKDDELLKLVWTDAIPNIKRTKTYELTTKVNALATMIRNGIYGEHAIKTVPLFDDPNETWKMSKPIIEAIQDTLKGNKEDNGSDIGFSKTLSDNSDQISNSPNIDGMRTGKNETSDSNEKQ